MKKHLAYSLLPFLSLSLFPFYSQSQTLMPDFKSMSAHTITSVIENKTRGSIPIALVGDHKATDNPGDGASSSKTEKLTWVSNFEDKKNGEIAISKKLKRIIFILDNPFSSSKYDSDNSFESTDGSERIAKNFTALLGIPSAESINSQNPNTTNPHHIINKTDALWNSELPVYDSTLYLNGLIFTAPIPLKLEKNTSWNTEMTLKDRVIKNIYTIENIIAGEIIISLKSKEIYKNAVKSSLTAEGAPSDLSFGLEKKEKSFEGSLTINAKTLVIESGIFQLETISDLTIGGSVSQKNSYSTTTITNTLK